MLAILALRRPRQENYEFDASPCCIETCHKCCAQKSPNLSHLGFRLVSLVSPEHKVLKSVLSVAVFARDAFERWTITARG